jgi:hypothetical protein
VSDTVEIVEEREHTWDDVRDCWEQGGGLRECADLIGVSYEAVRLHAVREGWVRQGQDAQASLEQRRAQTANAVEQSRLKWANRRSDEADAAGVTASIARQKIVEALKLNDHHMVRAAVGAYMVLVDRAQLLSGAATDRTEMRSLDAVDAKAQLASVVQMALERETS